MFRFSRGEKKGNLWDQTRRVKNQISLENRVVKLVQSDQQAVFEFNFASVLKRVFALQVLNTFNFSKHLKLYLLQVWKKLLKTSNISIYSFCPILCTYTLFQNGGDPGWSGSSCTKTRHQGPRNTRASTRQPQGNGETYCEFRKKQHQNSEYHPLPT